MKYCSARTFMCAFYTFLVPAFSLQAGETPQETALERMRAGEIVVEEVRLEETGGTVRVSAFMATPARTAWEIVSGCDEARRYLIGMERCEVLINEPGRALTHHVVDPGLLAPMMDYRFETIREPYHRMEFELTEGNLKQMEGYWQFEPREGGIVVEHELRISPTTPAPRWLVRRKLRKDLPRMMSCIRGLSDGSMTETLKQADLASCQGDPVLPDQ